jgi:hypothetical protein
VSGLLEDAGALDRMGEAARRQAAAGARARIADACEKWLG